MLTIIAALRVDVNGCQLSEDWQSVFVGWVERGEKEDAYCTNTSQRNKHAKNTQNIAKPNKTH